MRAITSASNIYRRKLCPGSHNAEAGIIDESGPAADEGTLLHPFAIDPRLTRHHLTSAQQRLLEKADRAHEEFTETIAERLPEERPARWSYERVPVKGPDGETLFDGEADLAMHFAESELVAIEDFKMGFADVTEAISNYQLASYAIAWTDYLGVSRAYVAINQPRSERNLTVASYKRPNLDSARLELASIYHSALDPNAPRIAGEKQCHWCKAKLWCDEYKARFRTLKHAPDSRTIATLDSESLGQLAIAVKSAARIQDAVLDEIRRRISQGEMPGWHLEENGETREVTNIIGAYNALRDFFEDIGGIDPARFTECTRLSLTKLSDYLKQLTGLTEARSKALVSRLLNPYIERKPKRPTPAPNAENLIQ